jgi:WD40 repeat protein
VSFEFGSRFQRSWITRDLQLALALFTEDNKRFLKLCRAGKEAVKLADWPKDITCFDCSGDLTRFVAGCNNGELILWRLDDPKAATEGPVAQKCGSVTAVVFSPNGKRFATGGWDSLVKIWKSDGTLERTLYENTLPVGRLWWSADGKQLLVVAMNGTFCRWTVGDGTGAAGTIDDGRLESRILINDNGKPIRIGRDGRIASPEPQSIGEELCALLEKPDGSVEIVEYAEFLKRTGLAAQGTTDPKRN